MENKKTGIELIAEERQRQIEVEGYDVTRDVDFYEHGELMGAAGCYISNALNKGTEQPKFSHFKVMDPIGRYQDAWPWDKQYDKREKHDAFRSLVIAGALIAAEIDRLQNQPINHGK